MSNEFNATVTKSREIFLQAIKVEGLSLEFVDEKEFRKVLDVHYNEVFDSAASNYIVSAEEKNRMRLIFENYQNIHTDLIIVRDENKNFVAHFMGESEDHTTYYLRNAGLIHSYRQKRLATNFISAFMNYLYSLGYSRVTSQHHGNNNAVLILMLKLGFHISGMETREEWGTLIKLVKHLNPERAIVFDQVLKGSRGSGAI